MRKNKKDPATARPDITHQVRHCVCFVSSLFLRHFKVEPHLVNTVIMRTKGIHSQLSINTLGTGDTRNLSTGDNLGTGDALDQLLIDPTFGQYLFDTSYVIKTLDPHFN